MKSRTLGLSLLLPASLLAFSGCVTPPDGGAESDVADETEVASAQAPLHHGSWSTGLPINGAFGYGTPALSLFKNRMHMVYRGLHNNNLYTSSLFNNAWSNPVAIPNVFSRVNPALGVFGGRMMMVYPHHQTNRYMSSFYDGNSWSPASELGLGLMGGIAPALGFYNGRMHMVYRGLQNQLFATNYNGQSWASPYALNGVFSRVTPSLAAYGNRLNLIYPSLYNNNLALAAYDGFNWGSPSYLPSLYSPWSPGVGIYNNALNVIYPTSLGGLGGLGGYGGYGLDWSLFDGQSWGAGTPLNGFRAAYSPVLGAYGGGLNMVYPDSAGQYYWSRCD